MGDHGSLCGLTFSEHSRFAIGVVLLIIVDVIWVASAALTKYIYDEDNFSKPLFTTYFKTVLFSVYLLGFFLPRWRTRCHSMKSERKTYTVINPSGDRETDLEGASDSGVNSESASRNDQLANASSGRLDIQESDEKESLLAGETCNELTVRETVRISAMFMALWFAGNYFYQLAFTKSSVATVNILSSTSSLFVLVVSALLPSCDVERLTATKVALVLICVLGASLVSVSDSEEASASSSDGAGPKWDIGVLYALLGALLYGLYLVILKRRVGPLQRLSVPMFFGFVGLWCALLIWPFLFVFHYTGIETFELPNDVTNGTYIWEYLTVNGLVGTVLSEALWLVGVFLTSPLVGTLALVFVNPLSLAYSLVRKQIHYSTEYVMGSALVTVAFFMTAWLARKNYPDPVGQCLRRAWQWCQGRLAQDCCCCLRRDKIRLPTETPD